LSHRHVAAAAHIPSRSSATFGRGGDFILIFGAHISAPSVAVLVVEVTKHLALAKRLAARCSGVRMGSDRWRAWN
jgi:hypothetical protein